MCNSHVKPGGWVEHVEISTIVRTDDDSIPADSAMLEWGDRWAEVGEKIGYSFKAAELAYPAITAAGFVNVTERVLKIPIGRWPRDKRLKAWGQWYQYFLLQGVEGFALRSFVDVLEVRALPFDLGMLLTRVLMCFLFTVVIR